MNRDGSVPPLCNAGALMATLVIAFPRMSDKRGKTTTK